VLVKARSSIGSLPLVPIGIGAGVAWSAYEWADPFLQLIGAKPAPALTPTPTVLQEPPAPITREALRRWTPEWMAESTAQRAEEQKLVHQETTATGTSAPQLPSPATQAISWVVWLALALAGGALALAILPRGGH